MWNGKKPDRFRLKEKKVVKKKLLISIFVVCPLLSGCKDLAKNQRAEFVDRKYVFPSRIPTQRSNSLTLVEIAEVGWLSLNKIETGTITDPARLSENMKSIFPTAQRRK